MKKRKLLGVTLLLCILCLFTIMGCGRNDTSMNESSQIQIQPKKEEKKEPVITEVKLSVVGDIMVHSYQYNEAYDSATESYNFMHNFQDMKKYFADSDMVIGNFETTLGGEGKTPSDYPMFSTPDSFLDALKDAGFTILTTANNHCMDTFQTGLIRTLDKLDEYGFDHIGTYRSKEERDAILIKEVNGIKFAFLSYTYGTNGIKVPESYLVNHLEQDLIQNDIAKAKEQGAEMIVILPHMGIEYELEPREEFKQWADMMFQAGADIILASHPHVLQPMEYKEIDNGNGTTRKGFIIYSLGNFISSQTTPPRNASIVLHITVEKTDDQKPVIKNVSFVPIWTQFRGTDGQDHFVVRSVYEMLTLPQEEQKQLLRQKDIVRLKEIHKETTSLYLNKEIPLEEIQDEYEFSMEK